MAQDDRVRKSSDGFDIVEVYRRQNEAISRIQEQLAEEAYSIRGLVDTAKALEMAGHSMNAERDPEQQRSYLEERRYKCLSKMALDQHKKFCEKTTYLFAPVTPIAFARLLRRLETTSTGSTKRRN